MEKYYIIENFLSKDDCEHILNDLIDKNEKKLGRFGDRVRLDQKNRYENVLKHKQAFFLEKKLDNIKIELYKRFNCFLVYHEKWKIGYYNGNDNSFYTEHRDNQCRISHRNVSCIIFLSEPDSYTGGELYLRELDKSFKLNKGSVIFFDSNLMHGVRPVTYGDRYVAISFLFDAQTGYNRKGFNYLNATNIEYRRKFLLPLTPDSGPGNQIVSIKEALMLSKLLNRVCILPPIHSHYTQKKVFWNFDEIYNVKDYLCNYYDTSKDYTFNNIYGCHGKYTFETLKIEKYLKIKDKNIELLKKRKFTDLDNLTELQNKDDNILCLKHLWNHVCFNTCSTNGCSRCDYNPIYSKLYEDICFLIDFSDNIKMPGDVYIQEKLKKRFIAVHIRYPDKLSNDSSLKDYVDYSEQQIFDAIENLKKQKDITSVFIATNNVNEINNSPLKNYFVYDIDTENPINSFIEQYICCCSEIFVLSRYNDYKKKDNHHIRSTWSSFVYDYRFFKNKNNNNIYIDSLICQ